MATLTATMRKQSQVDIDRLAARFEPALRRSFLAAVAAAQGAVPLGALADAVGQGYDAVMAVLAQAQVPAAVLDDARQVLTDTFMAAGRASGAQFNMVFNLPEPSAAAQVWRTVEQEGWLRFGTTPEWRQVTADVIRQAFLEGGHPYETARLIRGGLGMNAVQYGAYQRYQAGLEASGVSGAAFDRACRRLEDRYIRERALTVARSETIRVAQQGQLAVWQQGVDDGVLIADRTHREWIAASDACDICANMNGTVVGWGEPFPGYGDEAYAHPNCRCSAGLVFYDVVKAWVVKPLGDFADWDACVTTMSRRLGSRAAAERYCGKLEQLING